MNSHHLILGGCGFIGRHVAILLAHAGHRVTLADRAPLARPLPDDVADSVGLQLLEVGSAD